MRVKYMDALNIRHILIAVAWQRMELNLAFAV